MVDQNGTCTYKASKVIPLSFPELLKHAPFKESFEDVP